jgi:hypothetical protein
MGAVPGPPGDVRVERLLTAAAVVLTAVEFAYFSTLA